MQDVHLDGERLEVMERVVVSPTQGVFQPDPSLADMPVSLAKGQVVGTIRVLGVDDEPVASKFSGELMAMLALPGERVGVGQPLAWLRAE